MRHDASDIASRDAVGGYAFAYEDNEIEMFDYQLGRGPGNMTVGLS